MPNINISDKMAYGNSADPDQKFDRSTLFAIPRSSLWNKCIKKVKQKSME